ncbi:MAG: hypothetical protein IBX39_08300 [Candidatus Methanoperedenaceae archaeon]|nr:hypothetical protein [Candidatus Methanoperedenaceae archaeon]
MEKKKPNKKFSHLETDHLRATFIEDEETHKNWDSKITRDSIMISPDDGTHPAYEGAKIKLEGFSILKDPAGDPILYFKGKPKDNTILCHCTSHPDSRKALNKLKFHAKKNGIYVSTIESHIKDMKHILLNRYNATLKTNPGVHPDMGYIEEDDEKE